ncbi:hypothetical protein J3E68DRAFT_224818 [Trichoderma sp. SZMC 28012]
MGKASQSPSLCLASCKPVLLQSYSFPASTLPDARTKQDVVGLLVCSFSNPCLCSKNTTSPHHLIKHQAAFLQVYARTKQALPSKPVEALLLTQSRHSLLFYDPSNTARISTSCLAPYLHTHRRLSKPLAPRSHHHHHLQSPRIVAHLHPSHPIPPLSSRSAHCSSTNPASSKCHFSSPIHVRTSAPPTPQRHIEPGRTEKANFCLSYLTLG